MGNIKDESGKVYYFSQNLPTHQNAKDVPNLLRWVADTIENLGDVHVKDISMAQPYTKGSFPSLDVFYESEASGGNEDRAAHSMAFTLQGDGSADIPSLLEFAARRMREDGVSAERLCGLSFQNTLSERDQNGDTYSFTIYYV